MTDKEMKAYRKIISLDKQVDVLKIKRLSDVSDLDMRIVELHNELKKAVKEKSFGKTEEERLETATEKATVESESK